MKEFLIFVFLFMSLALCAFQNGEKLTFEIKYGVISAGEATLSIQESTYQDSVPAYRILSKASTNSFFDNIYKVRDTMESIWRKRDLVTLRFSKKLREGSYRQHRIH
ncbi:MAG TPA: DUF3108 domain-containing protein, partial [Candidatus Cloacimonadota bacterium]|nr:DUF3108 domain-containing protein [Candidatus Cloacimonadota bacterium]